MRGIDAINIKTGISLGKALCLRIGKDVGKIAPFAFHCRQDEIAGTVENAIHPVNPVRRRAIAQPLNHRNAAGHCCFKFQRCIFRLRQRAKFGTVVRDHCLVGGDKRAPDAEGFTRQSQGGTV